MYPIISNDPVLQAEYEAMREAGESHNFAEMAALRAPPGSIGSDRAFLEGHCNGRQFEREPIVGDYYKREAAAAGVDITGKVYLSQLAERPGDPRAWVSGRDDVKRVCEERGWGCQGSVTVAAQGLGATPPPAPRMAPELVNAKVHEILQGKIDAGEMTVAQAQAVDTEDLGNQVIERHGIPERLSK
jgi:hypothetical protein